MRIVILETEESIINPDNFVRGLDTLDYIFFLKILLDSSLGFNNEDRKGIDAIDIIIDEIFL